MDEEKSKILVVDDEPAIRELLCEALKPGGYEVMSVADGQEGLKAFFSWRPSLVVLDVRMPHMDGWDLLERIREVSEVPVIFLSALNDESHTVRGLHQGADDYVRKPIRLNEFLARVEAALRKSRQHASATVDEYSDSVLHLDFQRHRVLLQGSEVRLSAQEFRLLAALVRNAGLVLSSDRLLDLCWEGEGGPENVRVFIGYLRKKLSDGGSHPRLVETIRGFGYRYCPTTE